VRPPRRSAANCRPETARQRQEKTQQCSRPTVTACLHGVGARRAQRRLRELQCQYRTRPCIAGDLSEKPQTEAHGYSSAVDTRPLSGHSWRLEPHSASAVAAITQLHARASLGGAAGFACTRHAIGTVALRHSHVDVVAVASVDPPYDTAPDAEQPQRLAHPLLSDVCGWNRLRAACSTSGAGPSMQHPNR
jgi:hypothetical protein